MTAITETYEETRSDEDVLAELLDNELRKPQPSENEDGLGFEVFARRCPPAHFF